MRKMNKPKSEDEWNALATALVRAHLGLANMSLVELEQELRKLGIEERSQNLSVKIARGKFSAAFFLQVLVCTGARDLIIPTFE